MVMFLSRVESMEARGFTLYPGKMLTTVERYFVFLGMQPLLTGKFSNRETEKETRASAEIYFTKKARTSWVKLLKFEV